MAGLRNGVERLNLGGCGVVSYVAQGGLYCVRGNFTITATRENVAPVAVEQNPTIEEDEVKQIRVYTKDWELGLF